MKKILFILMILTSLTAAAQKSYEVSKDPKNDRVVFSGPITFKDLEGEPTFTWFTEGRENYKLRKKQISYLRDKLKKYNMVVFMGTWCGDSHEIIPKLQRVLMETGYPMSKYTMYGVDRSKTSKDAGEKKYNITLVPTIILLRDGKEIGRITETAHKNIEIDLAEIVKSDPNADQ